MEYRFLNNELELENIDLQHSDKINPYILKNNSAEIIKGIDFLHSQERFLYVYGFLGTGKRQVINCISENVNKDVIKLEYYCKQSTVCDDILLYFVDKIENNSLSKAVNLNVKISTMAIKCYQYISSIKKPFLVVLHSFDDIEEDNKKLIQDFLSKILTCDNVKIILSTRGLNQDIIPDNKIDRTLFIKAFTKEIFKDFVSSSNVSFNDKTLEDFYKYTRGYYYYTALAIKIIQAMKISLSDFVEKFVLSGMDFDTYLGVTYLNLIPQSIRNFFWFLRTVRHGMSLNALAVYELYDEFSINYLKANLMIFESDETIYVQDYFLQNIDISIPEKTEKKLHKYIIGIYEKELKEPLKTRSIMLSRQALRAEIEYHNNCIENLSGNLTKNNNEIIESEDSQKQDDVKQSIPMDLSQRISEADDFYKNDNPTKAVELYNAIIEENNLDSSTLNEIRHRLAVIYKNIEDYEKAQHYYELVEKYYKCNNEQINLNYLYYEMTDLYHLMYKNERAIETIKKVIYSVDTPQSLMVSACTLLGNIYSDAKDSENAYSYYQKALDSMDENISKQTLCELYFKYALANDERGDVDKAFEYYNKCIAEGNSPYKSPAYSNLGSCYYESGNFNDAEICFKKAYDIEKSENNYDGIYYTSMSLAKILKATKNENALNYLLEAKQSAEFINEESYILDSSIELGDYYYDNPQLADKALKEYFKAKNAGLDLGSFDMQKIEQRIEDMRLRMNQEDFEAIKNKYDR